MKPTAADPDLRAFVRALARADAEERLAPYLRKLEKARLANEARLRDKAKEKPFVLILPFLPCPEDSRIYFMRAGSGPIKIGRSADPEARRRSLQTASGAPLSVLATIPGGREHEAHLHHVFEPERLKGEWFAASPRLLDYIESLR